jgi:CAAX prenyl protease-like protein
MQPRSSSPAPAPPLWRYVGPFGLFIILQALPGMLRANPAPFWRAVPEFWLYPLQTIVCAVVLLRFRAAYPRWISVAGALFGAAIGVAVFVVWVSPQVFFQAAPRVSGGFDPRLLPPGAGGGLYTAVVALRFVRLVLVVPVLEEVFWRGFLLRYLVREDFLSVPFGTWTPFSFGVVALGFMLEHNRPDWPAALLTGVLYNWVAVRTKSLPACILAHALTNLLLGIYIMQTQQWGFW